jgi:hypothetical protein
MRQGLAFGFAPAYFDPMPDPNTTLGSYWQTRTGSFDRRATMVATLLRRRDLWLSS